MQMRQINRALNKELVWNDTNTPDKHYRFDWMFRMYEGKVSQYNSKVNLLKKFPNSKLLKTEIKILSEVIDHYEEVALK